MKTRVLERAKSNLLLLCASIVTVKNIVLNSYDFSYIVPYFYNYFENMLSLVWACLKDAASVPICLPMRYPIYSFTLAGVSNLSAMIVP